MSVSGISSNNNSLALYLLQQNQETAKQTKNTSDLSNAFSSPALTIGSSNTEDGEDGTYSTAALTTGSETSDMSNFAKDLQSLLSATQSGDTASAQTDAAAVENDLGLSSSTATASADSSSGSGSMSQFMTDLKSLLSAVKSGDMTTAQSAANSIQQDLQSMPPPPPSSVSSNDGMSSSSSTATPASFNNFISDLSDLLNASSSGDTISAQTAAAKVETDLQALTSSTTGSDSSTSDMSSTASSTATSTNTSSSSSDTSTSEKLAEQIMQDFMNALASAMQQSPMTMASQS